MLYERIDFREYHLPEAMAAQAGRDNDVNNLAETTSIADDPTHAHESTVGAEGYAEERVGES